MDFLYNIGIAAYSLGIRAVAPFNEKANLLVKGRKEVAGKIDAIHRGNERLVWFHAASLGEFEQGRPVMERLRQDEPETKILLTFFSPSGYEIRKNYDGADYVLYLPADTKQNAVHLIETLRPDAAVFIKYEFWYNYLHELYKRHIPIYLISAIFRPYQTFFQSWGKLHRRMLGFFEYLFVQDGQSVGLLLSIGCIKVCLSGDTRFDRVRQIADAAQEIEKVQKFCNNHMTIVCGSTWPPDEEIIMKYINRDISNCKWIIAPHEVGEAHIEAIMEKCKKKVVRYSQTQVEWEKYDVLVIDCIGLLSAVYRYGRIAYIGGGFGVGIHNTLEAAVYGMPVIFGPKYKKFNEAVGLVHDGGAFSVKNAVQLKDVIDKLMTFPTPLMVASDRAQAFVNSRTGATDIIYEKLKKGKDERL